MARKEIGRILGLILGSLCQVIVPENEVFGDYSTNAAFKSAKESGRSPREEAERIVREITEKQKNPSTWLPSIWLGAGRASKKIIDRAEVAGGGFVNFWLSNDFIVNQLNRILENRDRWGESKEGKGRVVIVEYFQPNVAKVLHVGHLPSAIIGDALKRILKSQGYKAVSDTHIGDWGTQFGILLCGWKHISEEEKKKIKAKPIEELNSLYVEESKKIEDDPERRELAKGEFAKLEKGDKENRKIWEWMVRVSMDSFLKVANRLGLTRFEEHMGESAYEKKMPEIVDLALQKGVARKLEDGAVIVDLGGAGLGQAVLIKSDGASTYLLRDLATIRHRIKKWRFYKNLYVVDVRQSLHFKQVFRVAEIMGFDTRVPLDATPFGTASLDTAPFDATPFGATQGGQGRQGRQDKFFGAPKNLHIEFGFMSLPEGAMSTRKGNAISLVEVLDDVISRAREVIREKNPELKNADRVAEMVGLGALKYFDLSHQRKSNVIFNREKSLSFEGNTGPYIQYTNARLQSILRKARTRPRGIKDHNFTELERSLAVLVLRFPEVVSDVLNDWSPNILANYMFDLARKANEWYHSHPVLKEEDRSKRELRLALVAAVSITLTKGLDLLGIEAPNEM